MRLGCAGIFNAPVAIQVFAEEDALDRLEAFASLNGPAFYGLPPNEERITLHAKPLAAPERVEVPGGNEHRRDGRNSVPPCNYLPLAVVWQVSASACARGGTGQQHQDGPAEPIRTVRSFPSRRGRLE